MEHFQQIIKSLDKEDARYYKLFISSYKTTNERKDLLLFDLVRSGKNEYNDNESFRKIYKKTENKNALYRLKNKVIEDVGYSLVCRHTSNHSVMMVCHNLQLAYLFSYKSIPATALYYLKKAERICKKEELYEALDIIYTEIIRLSHEYGVANPFDYLKTRKINSEKINQLRKVDDLLVVIKHKLKISQNYASEKNAVFDTLQKEIDEMKFSTYVRNSLKFKTHIYEAVSKMLLSQQNFAELEQFTLKTYQAFVKQNLFTKENHELKLKMLTYLVNSSFKCNKHKESLAYTQQLHQEMQAYQSFLYDKYYFFYINSQVINYSSTNKQKGIELLEALKLDERLKKVGFYEIFVYINLTVLYFDLEQYQKSLKNIISLKLMDSFKNADESLKLKICIVELMLRVEQKDYDVLITHIKHIEKDFEMLLKKKNYLREKAMISVIKVFTKKYSDNNLNIAEKNKNEITKVNYENAGDIIFYNTWIKKMLKLYKSKNIF